MNKSQGMLSRMRALGRRGSRWCRDVLLWVLLEWRGLWLGLLVPAAIYVAWSAARSEPESAIRLAGMTLQVSGFITVLWGLDGRWRSLMNTGPLKAIAGRFARFPRWKRDVVMAAGGAVMTLAGGRARATIRAGEGASLEKRVSVLERNVESLEREVGDLGDSTDKRFSEADRKLTEESRANARRHSELADRMKQTMLGGVGTEVLGVWFFLVGVVMGTASPEIRDWFFPMPAVVG